VPLPLPGGPKSIKFNIFRTNLCEETNINYEL
jgi:hypothetical protein